jgi:hypothetical protein
MTEREWAKASESKRQRAKLWTRREWASVSRVNRDKFLHVGKTFGGLKNGVGPRTESDNRCYEIHDLKGRKVAFDLGLTEHGRLLTDAELPSR